MGIAVGIIDHGRQSIYVAGETGDGRKVDERTLFEIGSVTKTFTATTLATMVLAKQVRLSDPISEYLPQGVRAPSKDGKPITLLTLAEQRSGLPRLPSNANGTSDDPYAQYGNAQMYAFLSSYSLTRDPGAEYEYSNYGIGLLGQLLANRAGIPYPQLLSRSVLDPLGMHDTALVLAGVPDPAGLAVGHDLAGNALTTWHFQSVAPAGAIASNLTDMLKYLRCNMGHGPLARACLFAQKPRARGLPGEEIGLVWNLDSKRGMTWHNGATNGFNAYLGVSRDRQTGVVVLGNGPVVDDIGEHVIAPAAPLASCPTTVPAAKTDPASYTGVYCNASSAAAFTVDASSTPDGLTIALLPQPAFEYARVATDTYLFAKAAATIKFVRQSDGVVGLWLLQGGAILPAPRLNAGGDPILSRLPSPFPPEIELPAPLLQQYVGAYTADGFTFTISSNGKALSVQLTGQPAFRIYASAKDEFFLKDVWAQIHFDRNAAGGVNALTLHQNGQEVKALRTPP